MALRRRLPRAGCAGVRVTTYRLGRATIEHDLSQTHTVFDDGAHVVALHAPQARQAETAAQHGLTVCGMNRTHDLAHSLLAVMLGLPASPTLEAVARGERWPHWHREEAAVLCLQGYAAALGISLEDVAARWSKRDESTS